MTELDVRYLHNQLKSGLVAWRRVVVVNRLINDKCKHRRPHEWRTELTRASGADEQAQKYTSATS